MTKVYTDEFKDFAMVLERKLQRKTSIHRGTYFQRILKSPTIFYLTNSVKDIY